METRYLLTNAGIAPSPAQRNTVSPALEGLSKSSGFAPPKALQLLVKSSAFNGQKHCFSNTPLPR
jgi:hypothetical protein